MLPYIVCSRKNKELEKNLLKDDYPILFEGLHTCYLLNNPLFADRKKMVRTHNIEHQYYMRLFLLSDNPKAKIYYLTEAFRLRFFEKRLRYANNIFAISTTDRDYFRKKFTNVKVDYLPCFFNNVISGISLYDVQRWQGDYILFNADLSIESNAKVALFLIDEVMPLVDKKIKLVIAGKNPLSVLVNKANGKANTELIMNVPQDKMDELINQARVNLLFSFSASGVKLKLLTVLWHSCGHCLANGIMMQGTNLGKVCPVVDTPQDIAEKINQLYDTLPSESVIGERRELISEAGYTNDVSLIVNS